MKDTGTKEVNTSLSDDISQFISHSQCTMIAGGIAGCVGKTITAPLSRLTILLQVSPLQISQSIALGNSGVGPTATVSKSSGLFYATRRVFKEEGILSFWKGNLTSVFHRFPYSAINFTVYDELQMLTRRLNGRETPMTRFLSGSIAGGVACFACYPLDLVRTQLTVLKTPVVGAKRSVFGAISTTIQTIIESEGISGLYRGLLISLAVTIPTFGISFCVYGTVKEHLLNQPSSSSLNFFKDASTGHLNAYGSMFSGAMSGIISSILLFPADSIRRRIQVEKVLQHQMEVDHIVNNKKSGAINEITRVLRAHGVKGLYRGLVPELLKVTPMVSITFCVYEFSYDLLSSTIFT